jgi:hypothetical protein
MERPRQEPGPLFGRARYRLVGYAPTGKLNVASVVLEPFLLVL